MALVVGVGAVLAAAALVVGLVLIFRASGGHEPDRRVSLPNSAGDYQLIRSIGGPSVVAMLGNQLATLGPISQALNNAQVGVYGIGSSPDTLPTVVFLGFNRADSRAVDDLLGSGSADRVAGQVLTGAGAGESSGFDTGPMGGALRCAAAHSNTTVYTPCVWVDHSTLGVVLRVGNVDLGDAAGVTLQFRAAAEH